MDENEMEQLITLLEKLQKQLNEQYQEGQPDSYERHSASAQLTLVDNLLDWLT